MRIGAAPLGALLLGACATVPAAERAAVPVTILAFNDFHGNLEPPAKSISAPTAAGGAEEVPAGGVSYLATLIRAERAAAPGALVVSAGDLVGASPLVSALFLDEPTIVAMNMIGLDFNAVGNHEYDRGTAELVRKQEGGCARHTDVEPCRIERGFAGARFRFLAANSLKADGAPLFAPYAIRTIGKGTQRVRIGFIGLTLQGTGEIVRRSGLAGVRFADEADTANALVPKLKAAGADAIVVLIHQGGRTDVRYNDKSCAGLSGDIVPILDRLDPAIDVVVSGHTHQAYVCDYGQMRPGRSFLLTSAGQYGTLLTRIRLSVRRGGGVAAKSADNLIVQGEPFIGPRGPVPLVADQPRQTPAPDIAALVGRYADATRQIASQTVGQLAGPLLKEADSNGESVLGDVIADAQLAATAAPASGNAQIAFMNSGGIRADLVPAADGSISFGQIYSVQPFGNLLSTRSYTGRQLLAILEQQFSGQGRRLLQVSLTLHYRYDERRPEGARVFDVMVSGRPLDPAAVYRVTVSDFLAEGGDGFTAFRAGTDPAEGPTDLAALQKYLEQNRPLAPPPLGRIVRAGA
jgi:5'-nucleotidase